MPVLGVSISAKDAESIYFSKEDTVVLRRLAEQVAEIAQKPVQSEKRKLWVAHNSLQNTRPVVLCDPENGWNEIISLSCTGLLARCYEWVLRKDIFWDGMGDDKVVEAYIDAPYLYTQTDMGLPLQKLGENATGAYTWLPPLTDYNLIDQLKPQEIVVDYEKSEQLMALVQETFGHILTVRRHTNWWWSLGMTRELIFLRGMERFYFDLYDYPEEVKLVMNFLRDAMLSKLDFLQSNHLLSPNANDTYVGSGGFGYTTELAKDPIQPICTTDMWGFCESQETVSMASEMFEEFVFPYQQAILKRFGLNCYGCCEPLEKRWSIVKNIPNLRRVSVSSWADKAQMAQNLGGNYIYSYKPKPTPLASQQMDEKSVREELRQVLDVTNGCHVELIMKDNHTIGNNPNNVIRWCQIAQEMAALQNG